MQRLLDVPRIRTKKQRYYGRSWMYGRMKLYLSYAREDKKLVRMLETHLATLRREGIAETVDARSIGPGVLLGGRDWRAEVAKELDDSQIVLLLLSADYLASDYLLDAEAKRALELHRQDKARAIPIVLRPCDWQESPLGRLQALPRGGKPVTNWGDLDEAFADVARGLRNVIVHFTPRPFADVAKDARREEPVAVAAPDPITTIFNPTGLPEVTYVEPDQFDLFKTELAMFGRGLIVEGPSGIGKTTTTRKALAAVASSVKQAWISGVDDRDLARLDVLLDEGLDGHLVVDDFHHLSNDRKKQVARAIKKLADTPQAKSKITVVGINPLGFSLVEGHHELSGRVGTIPLKRSSDAKVQHLIESGERAAKLQFVARGEIVEAAAGSFFTAQQLCYHLCVKAGIHKGQSALVRIEYGPNDVLAPLLEQLDFKYRRPLNRFASFDASCSPNGACLVLLWLLRLEGVGYVLVDEARKQYPHLSQAFDWLENGKLAECVDSTQNVRQLLFFDEQAQVVGMENPQLEFYLKNMPWIGFARQAGHSVSISSDDVLMFKRPPWWKRAWRQEIQSDNLRQGWWRTALTSGIIAAVSFVVLATMPPEWNLLRAALVVGSLVFVLVLLRNPRTRYMRSFWAVFGVFGSGNSLPSLGIEATGEGFWVRLLTEGPGPIFNVVAGVTMITLLLLDWKERNEQFGGPVT